MKIFDEAQEKIFAYALRSKHPAIFVDPRVGKTLPTIRAINSYKKEEKDKILIVCPLSAIDDWVEELKGEKEKNFIVINGSKKDRIRKVNLECKWSIINYEGLMAIKKELSKNYDTVVLDEAHLIKDPRAKRTKFIVKAFRSAKHRWALTGTPSSKSDLDYFSILQWLDESILGYKNYFVWQMENWIRQNSFKSVMKSSYVPIFKKILANTCLFISRKDVNKEPKWLKKKVFFALPEEIRNVYKQIEEEFVLDYNRGLKTFYTMQRDSWLKDVVSGFIGDDLVSDCAIKCLIKLILSIKTEKPIIIWAVKIKELDLIANSLSLIGPTVLVKGGLKKDEDKEIYKRFKNNEFRFLVANPVVWSTSKNLSNAYGMIYFSFPQQFIVFKQSMDRCVNTRDLQDQNVYFIVGKNTISEDTLDYLNDNNSRISLRKHSIKQILRRNRAKRFNSNRSR